MKSVVYNAISIGAPDKERACIDGVCVRVSEWVSECVCVFVWKYEYVLVLWVFWGGYVIVLLNLIIPIYATVKKILSFSIHTVLLVRIVIPYLQTIRRLQRNCNVPGHWKWNPELFRWLLGKCNGIGLETPAMTLPFQRTQVWCDIYQTLPLNSKL